MKTSQITLTLDTSIRKQNGTSFMVEDGNKGSEPELEVVHH
jgi:hypothetical protein